MNQFAVHNLGVSFVDEHYAVFLRLAGRLCDALRLPQQLTRIEKVRHALIEQTAFHFSAEELAMQHCMLPEHSDEMMVHIRDHHRFWNWLEHVQHESAEHAETFIRDWLSQHTQHHDRILAQYWNEEQQRDAERHVSPFYARLLGR